MAKLTYSILVSLDGYIADEDGNFDWAVPDEEVHRFVNDLERGVHRRFLTANAPWRNCCPLLRVPQVMARRRKCR